MKRPAHLTEPRWIQAAVIAVVALVFLLVLILPLAICFWEAFRKGFGPWIDALSDADALASIRLSLVTVAIAVPLNTAFGLAVSWAVAHHRFAGRSLLLAFIDLPIWVSPVVSGLIYVLLYGLQGLFGPWLIAHGVKVIFTPVAIIFATIFVTFPYVARQVIPVMEQLGKTEEEAAMVLGANGWQVFWRVTLPKVRWGLFFGVILCQARSLGEFGAVSVVSGHVRGLTNTMPLHIEILYSEYQVTAAFAVASLLASFALVTLALKSLVEARDAKRRAEARIMTAAE